MPMRLLVLQNPPSETQPEGKVVRYACAHWRSFPPPAAVIQRPIEELRAKKLIRDDEYQRYLVWEKVCGLVEMDEKKCLTCPHARTVEIRRGLPVLVTLDGKVATPTVDLPSLETSARHRKYVESLIKAQGEK